MSEKWHDVLNQQLQLRPEAPAFLDTLGAKWSFADTHKVVTANRARVRETPSVVDQQVVSCTARTHGLSS